MYQNENAATYYPFLLPVLKETNFKVVCGGKEEDSWDKCYNIIVSVLHFTA